MLVKGLGAQACSQDQSLGTGSNRKFQLSVLGVVRETELGEKADFRHLSQGTGASPDCAEKSLDMGVIRGRQSPCWPLGSFVTPGALLPHVPGGLPVLC